MKTKLLTFLFFWTCFFSLSAQTLGEKVVEINPELFKTKLPKSKLAQETLYMLRLNNKYTLNKWYNELKQFNLDNSDYLDFKGKLEKDIRPTSHHIFALALTLKLNIYDSSVTNVSSDKAFQILERLISSVSYRHKANNPKQNEAWGKHWQSALWAAQIAQGAWLVWDRLSATDRDMVAKMVEFEADRFITIPAPYYMDKDGNVISKGNTRAEENAWNSGVITMAILMLPNHINVDKWRERNIEYQASAYCTPEDLVSDKMVDGVALNQILKGSNAYSNGTVVNHDILHPDYMTAIMLNFTNLIYHKLAEVEPLESSTYNCDLVYRALTVEEYGGKTMYQPTEKGKASSQIYFPEGNDWGGERQANYWLMDIFADIYKWGKKGEVKPKDWALERSKEMMRMISRDTTGQYYQSQKEDKFFSREEWIGQHLAYGYMALWLLD
ncbi:MAG: hypothetical protein R3Y50_06400 [Rikenellaceae bacterium]